MYRKMTLIPTNAGILWECYYCKARMEGDGADNHECIARHAGHNVILTRQDTENGTALMECLDCPVTTVVAYGGK